MKNHMMTIIKKEFARFFGDKRLVFSTVILPGLMIYVLYSFMGKAMMSQFTTAEDYVFEVNVVNLPEIFGGLSDGDRFDLKKVDTSEAEAMKELVKNQEAELFMVFPEDFETKIASYDSMTATEPAPNVEVYYNSVSTESSSAYDIVVEMLEQYENALANKFDVNGEMDVTYDMATNEDTSAKFFAMMLPMLLMMFLFSGCMAIAPESIAGEKERGTIATLLVTPMKRSHLALGKIISLSVIGLLSGISSAFGTILSMPNLMGQVAEEGALNAGVYGLIDYVLLLIVILSTVLVIIGMISNISALSKSVKEAGTSVSPLMILIMVISVTSMMRDSIQEEMYWYLIPLYNSVQCMNGIFSMALHPMQFAVTIASNLIYTAIMVYGLTKMFDSEKIMYSV